jgi:hypothetical protein
LQKTQLSKKSEYLFKWGTLSASILALVVSFLAFNNSVDSKKISNRPYVVVEDIRYSGMPSLERGNSVDNFEVEVLVKNVGQTPAYNTVIKSTMNIYGSNFTIAPEFNKESETGKVLVNGSEYYFRVNNIRPFSIEKINEVNDKKSFIYVYGIISYSDIFHDYHVTKFCFRMDFLGFDGFKFFKTFNSAD